jgi:hypothetical protein
MDNSALKPGRILDRTAVTLSGLCLLHCLALPVVIALLPFANELGDGHWHAQMLIVVVPVSVVAFALGFRRHRSGQVIAVGTLGLLLLIIGGTVVHARYGIAADRAFTVAGALILAVAHFRNNRLTRHLP